MAKHVESLSLDQVVTEPTAIGSVWRDSGDNVKFRDGIGVLNVRDAVVGDQVKVSANDSGSGYLEDKVQSADGTVAITVVNEGAAEKVDLSANLTETFKADVLESQVAISTGSNSPQDAFAGSSLLIDKPGDYLILFESDSRMTNSNQEGLIGIGKNAISEVAGSVRVFGGNQRGSTVVVKLLPGLINGDTVHGLYRKVSPGQGSAELHNRSLTAFRIG
jgi:hypothetical protein